MLANVVFSIVMSLKDHKLSQPTRTQETTSAPRISNSTLTYNSACTFLSLKTFFSSHCNPLILLDKVLRVTNYYSGQLNSQDFYIKITVSNNM